MPKSLLGLDSYLAEQELYFCIIFRKEFRLCPSV